MAFFEELLASVLPTVSYADSEEEEKEDGVEETEPSKVEDNDEEKEDDEEGDDDEDEDEDDEDEEEPQDPFDELKEKFSKSICASHLHHYDECIERVTKAEEDPDYHQKAHKEDCVEEYFHLQHCINDNAAPILFHKLK